MVVDCYLQDIFVEYMYEFCELVMVWWGNGLYVFNECLYRIICGDLFYICVEDKYFYIFVNDLVL